MALAAAPSAGAHELRASVARFIDDWRRLQPAPLAARLAAFADAWRAAPRPNPIVPVSDMAPQLTANALASVTAELRPALARARASGARFNPWRAAGLGRDERRNAAALAQLLQPWGDHGLAQGALDGLFDALLEAAPDCPRPADLSRAAVQLEHRPMDSLRDRVDLVVDHPELLLFLEIKIDAAEGPEQLRRYVEAAGQAARFAGRPAWRVAYLTPRLVSAREGVIAFTWAELARRIGARLAAESQPPVQPTIRQLLDHFRSL